MENVADPAVEADVERPQETAPLGQALTLIERPKYELMPAPLEALEEVARIISQSVIANPSFQQAAVGDAAFPRCLAVAYQAARWRMDPLAVASQAFVTPVKGGGEKLSYQSQLVQALILSAGVLEGTFTFEFKGTGAQRYCICKAKLKGERRAKNVVSPIIGQIKPKNSPLWFSDPDQQLSYYTGRLFVRRYRPDVLMGVFSIDEMQVAEITHADPRERLSAFEEPEEVEAEDATFEPSGGEGWKPPPSDDGGQDQQQGRREPRGRASEASGGGESPGRPEGLDAALERVRAVVLPLEHEPDPAKIALAWSDLIESADFKMVVAYEQDVANSMKRQVQAWRTAAAKAQVKGGEG